MKTKNFKFWNKGFTLIELLVVIVIIGILAGFGAARYIVAEKQARDAQRKSDLNQYRVALESYASANNSNYPLFSNKVEITSLCGNGSPKFDVTYLSGTCLEDIIATNGNYYYASNKTDYALYAKLESVANTYYVICSTGKSGKVTGVPSITNGDCSSLVFLP